EFLGQKCSGKLAWTQEDIDTHLKQTFSTETLKERRTCEGDLDEICCMKEMCAHQLRVPTHSQKHLQGSDTHIDGPSDGSPVLQNQRLVSVSHIPREGGSAAALSPSVPGHLEVSGSASQSHLSLHAFPISSPLHHLRGPQPLTDPCCAPITPPPLNAPGRLRGSAVSGPWLGFVWSREEEGTSVKAGFGGQQITRGVSPCPKPMGGHNVSQQLRPLDEPV
ncbi:Myosin-6, partial [Dissostichus eleginoides]